MTAADPSKPTNAVPSRPRLLFFQWQHAAHEHAVPYLVVHMAHHVRCLAQFFQVTVINEDCDYQEVCDRHQPDLTLFESGYRTSTSRKPSISNIRTHPSIPKLGFLNADAWCDRRAGFLSDMEHWGIETYFSISVIAAEYTPEIADQLFIWPNFIDHDLYRDYGEAKSIPILLTGSVSTLYPWRHKVFKRLKDAFPCLTCPHDGYDQRNTVHMLQGESYARTINASFFAPTCGTIGHEVVRKHFEIPGARACLITERSPGLLAAGFIDMENCVFADESTIVDKVEYLLQHREELAAITEAGYRLVHARHTVRQRDQILQWYRLYSTHIPGQRIIQRDPFGPLELVDVATARCGAAIIVQGRDRMLLRKAEAHLRAGHIAEAATAYRSCLTYVAYLPEAKVGLALCHLLAGDAEEAARWLAEPLEITLAEYGAVDPDPVEWAYFCLTLLGRGSLTEAVEAAGRFPTLTHFELARVRAMLDFLSGASPTLNMPAVAPWCQRASLHGVPDRNSEAWLDFVIAILTACGQTGFAEALRAPSSARASESFRTDHVRGGRRLLWIERLIQHRRLRHLAPGVPPFQALHYSERLVAKMRAALVRRVLPDHVAEAIRRRRALARDRRHNDPVFALVWDVVAENRVRTMLVLGTHHAVAVIDGAAAGRAASHGELTAVCIGAEGPALTALQARVASHAWHAWVQVERVATENAAAAPLAVTQALTRLGGAHASPAVDMLVLTDATLLSAEQYDLLDAAELILIIDLHLTSTFDLFQSSIAGQAFAVLDGDPEEMGGYALLKRIVPPVTPSIAGRFRDAELAADPQGRACSSCPVSTGQPAWREDMGVSLRSRLCRTRFTGSG